MLWNIVSTGWAKFGVLLVFITGIGAIMGGVFDVQHKLHGLSFGIGVPFFTHRSIDYYVSSVKKSGMVK